MWGRARDSRAPPTQVDPADDCVAPGMSDLCEGFLVGLFLPSRAAPADLALAGGALGAPLRQRRGQRSCVGECVPVALMREDALASDGLSGAADGDAPAAALLCASCAEHYAARVALVGCTACCDALAVGLRHDSADVAGMCAPCALGAVASAAAEAAAAPLRARLAELDADAPRPPQQGKTLGRDNVAPGFDCCGARLGDGAVSFPVQLRGGGETSRPVGAPVHRLLRAPAVGPV